jgi:hypothetical protein
VLLAPRDCLRLGHLTLLAQSSCCSDMACQCCRPEGRAHRCLHAIPAAPRLGTSACRNLQVAQLQHIQQRSSDRVAASQRLNIYAHTQQQTEDFTTIGLMSDFCSSFTSTPSLPLSTQGSRLHLVLQLGEAPLQPILKCQLARQILLFELRPDTPVRPARCTTSARIPRSRSMCSRSCNCIQQ